MWTVRIALVGVLAGCGGGRSICPRPQDATAPTWADANGDGAVDVVDGVRIARASLSGGPPVTCRGQGDLLASGDVAMEAANQVWNWLFLGGATAMPELDGCELRQRDPAEATCSTMELVVTGPDRVEAASGATTTFEATVELHAGAVTPDAWSFGVSAEGCTIRAATREGTVADSVFAGGVVDLGFAHAAVVEGGAVSAVVPSWQQPVGVDASTGAAVLALTVEATAPSSGCQKCTVAVSDGLTGNGQAVGVVVGSAGWSYAPGTKALEARICAR